MSNIVAALLFIALCIGIASSHANTEVDYAICKGAGPILVGSTQEIEDFKKTFGLQEYVCESRKGTRAEFAELRSKLKRIQGH